MEKLFKLRLLGTNAKREMTAGANIFLTMFYIVIINPAILSAAGVPFEQVFYATILSAATGTLVMAFWANAPVAVAPAMGLNVYVANVVLTEGIPYEVAFGAVLLAAILFLLLSLSHYRTILIKALPDPLIYGVLAGIGLYIAFFGLAMSGIIVSHPDTIVSFGDVTNKTTLLTLFGIVVTLFFTARSDKGAIMLGMLVTGVIGYFLGLFEVEKVVSLPELPAIIDFDLSGVFSHSLFFVIVSVLLIIIIDAAGTMRLLDEDTHITRNEGTYKVNASYVSDSVATLVGALFGSTPAAPYIESKKGKRLGARSGLAALTVAVLLLLSVFFLPLVEAVSSVAAFTAPVLVIVGSFLFKAAFRINWHDFSEAFPAFLAMLTIPLTSSIAMGMAIGFVVYTFIQLVQGNGSFLHPIIYVLSFIFLLQIVFT